MPNGVDRRAQIDTETVKALLLMNGAGAGALLTFLPTSLSKPEYLPLAKAIFIGLMIFGVGLVFAVIHNRLRRKCSLIYDQHAMRPPSGTIFGIDLGEPRVCFISIVFMFLSLVAFVVAGGYVAVSGLQTISQIQKQTALDGRSLPGSGLTPVT